LAEVPRPPRIQVPGGIYHVTSRGNRRQAICHDDHDRRRFLATRDRVIRRCGWRLHAYCLMNNHFHLLVETPKPNLSSGMQRLKCDYAAYFNERHSLDGHLFQQRFDSRLIETEGYFAEVLRYIALNPVRARLAVEQLLRCDRVRLRPLKGVQLGPVWRLTPDMAGLAEAVRTRQAFRQEPD
jgi:putative transposase